MELTWQSVGVSVLAKQLNKRRSNPRGVPVPKRNRLGAGQDRAGARRGRDLGIAREQGSAGPSSGPASAGAATVKTTAMAESAIGGPERTPLMELFDEASEARLGTM